MKSLIFIPILALTIGSCSTQTETVKPEPQQSFVDSPSKEKKVLAKVLNFDTLTINKKAAVFYSPDSLQIAKRKKEIGEEDFYTGADDYLSYMHLSHDFLDSVNLTILDAKNKKVLRFLSNDKSQTFIKLDTLKELWGIYLFDPNKKQKLADMTVIDEEYKDYFK